MLFWTPGENVLSEKPFVAILSDLGSNMGYNTWLIKFYNDHTQGVPSKQGGFFSIRCVIVHQLSQAIIESILIFYNNSFFFSNGEKT